jgi:hypothetical protein
MVDVEERISEWGHLSRHTNSSLPTLIAKYAEAWCNELSHGSCLVVKSVHARDQFHGSAKGSENEGPQGQRLDFLGGPSVHCSDTLGVSSLCPFCHLALVGSGITLQPATAP